MKGRKPKPKPADNVVRMVPHWPKVLMRKPEAQAFWKWAVQQMLNRKTWHESWTQVLAITSLAVQDLEDIEKERDRLGWYVAGGSGAVKANPLIAAKKAALDSVMKGLAELGLTPTAAARFGDPNEGDDEFSKFLKQHA